MCRCQHRRSVPSRPAACRRGRKGPPQLNWARRSPRRPPLRATEKAGDEIGYLTRWSSFRFLLPKARSQLLPRAICLTREYTAIGENEPAGRRGGFAADGGGRFAADSLLRGQSGPTQDQRSQVKQMKALGIPEDRICKTITNPQTG